MLLLAKWICASISCSSNSPTDDKSLRLSTHCSTWIQFISRLAAVVISIQRLLVQLNTLLLLAYFVGHFRPPFLIAAVRVSLDRKQANHFRLMPITLFYSCGTLFNLITASSFIRVVRSGVTRHDTNSSTNGCDHQNSYAAYQSQE